MFTCHRLIPTNKLDSPHAMGINAFSTARAKSFRHILLLPPPSLAYHRSKPANLRVSIGARAAQFQASGLRVRSSAGAWSPAAQRTRTGRWPTQAWFWLEWGCPLAQRTTTAHACRCAEVVEARSIAAPTSKNGWPIQARIWLEWGTAFLAKAV